MPVPLLLADPKELPYGELSPLADGIVSKAYASLVHPSGLRHDIERKPAGKARIDSLAYTQSHQDSLYSKALLEALEHKYMTDRLVTITDPRTNQEIKVKTWSQAGASLLSVKEGLIVYESENRFLGVNSKGEGDNTVGIQLMNIRDQLREREKEQQKQKRREYLNKFYSVYETLKQDIMSGKNNLADYIGRDLDDILEMRFLTQEPITIVDIVTSKTVGLNEEVFNNFIEHMPPDTIATELRYKYHTDYNLQMKTNIEDDLVAYYMDRFLATLPDKPTDMSRFKLIDDLIKKNQMEPLIKRLVYLLEKGAFPDFSRKYTPILLEDKKYLEVIKEEVEEKQSRSRDSSRGKSCQKCGMQRDFCNCESLDSVFRFNDSSAHSPYAIEMFRVGLYHYPTVIHYVNAFLLHSLGHTIHASHDMIMKDKLVLSLDPTSYLSFQEMDIVYKNELNRYIYDTVTTKAKELLLKRFPFSKPKPTKLTALLVSTVKEFSHIVFNDPEDLILGGASNFAGVVLTELREKRFEEYGRVFFPPPPKPKTVTISSVIKEEERRMFCISRTKDMYDMIKAFNRYINTTAQSYQETDPYFYLYGKERRKTHNAPMFTDMDAFHFFYSNFESCLSKYPVPIKLDKSNLPTDFEKTIGKLDAACMAELWQYMVLNASISIYIELDLKNKKKVNEFSRLILSQREQTCEEAIDKASLQPEDEFYGLLSTVNTIRLDKDVVPISFGPNVLNVISPIQYELFEATEESVYSSLMPWHIDQVTRVFTKWFENVPHMNTIVDATAHIGVDTVHFGMMFPDATIYSYEIVEQTFKLLERNIEKFPEIKDRVHVYNHNLLTANLPAYSDFIYIDAPWGGKAYKKEDTMELYLDNTNIKEIARRLIVDGYTNTVVLKVPSNFNLSDLSTHFMVTKENILKRDRTISYILLKLTMTEQHLRNYRIKSLAITSFISIFDSLDAFETNFIIDKDAVLFAHSLMYLGTDNVVPTVEKVGKFGYESIIMKYLTNRGLIDAEILESSTTLSLLLKQCVDHIVQSIGRLNEIDVISRILMFNKSNKIIKRDNTRMMPDVEPLFIDENETQPEEEDEQLFNQQVQEDEDQEYEPEEEGIGMGFDFDFDTNFDEDEYQQQD